MSLTDQHVEVPTIVPLLHDTRSFVIGKDFS